MSHEVQIVGKLTREALAAIREEVVNQLVCRVTGELRLLGWNLDDKAQERIAESIEDEIR